MSDLGLSSFKKTISTASSPEPLGTIKASDFMIQAPSTNTANVLIGSQTDRHFELPPGSVIAVGDVFVTSSSRESNFDSAKIFVSSSATGQVLNVLHGAV